MSIGCKTFKADRFEVGLLMRAGADWCDAHQGVDMTVLSVAYTTRTGCPHHDEEDCSEGDEIHHAELDIYYDGWPEGHDEWVGERPIPRKRLPLKSDTPESDTPEGSV